MPGIQFSARVSVPLYEVATRALTRSLIYWVRGADHKTGVKIGLK